MPLLVVCFHSSFSVMISVLQPMHVFFLSGFWSRIGCMIFRFSDLQIFGGVGNPDFDPMCLVSFFVQDTALNENLVS